MGTRQKEKIQPQPDDSSTIDWEKSNYPIINSLNLDGDSASSRCNELQNKKSSEAIFNGMELIWIVELTIQLRVHHRQSAALGLSCVLLKLKAAAASTATSHSYTKNSLQITQFHGSAQIVEYVWCVYNTLYQFFYTFFGSYNIQHCSLRGAEENEIASMLLLR